MLEKVISDFMHAKSKDICDLSDKIWDNPELGYKEHIATEAMTAILEKEGFAVKKNLANIPTAFSASFGKGKPVIGILGEFDALPAMHQTANIANKESQTPHLPGHGCGHNLLGAAGIWAAIAVKEYLQQTNTDGTVVFFGCPAEEGGSGKAFMARENVFKDIDCALSWHPNEFNGIWAFSSLANIQVKYNYHGRSSHAAVSPHLGRSALDAVEVMNIGCQYLREHIIPEARIHYAVTNTGGTAPNIVQAEAEVIYLIRAPKNQQVKEIFERVNNIARGAALISETTVDITVEKACSNIVPNNTLEQVLHTAMKEVPLPTFTDEETDYAKSIQKTFENRTLPSERFAASMGEKGRAYGKQFDNDAVYSFILPYAPSEKPISGSSDVGDVSWVCPTSQFIAATCAAGTAAHSWQMVAQGKSSIAHKGLIYAGEVLAKSVISLINDKETVQKAKSEFENRVGTDGYKPLLDPNSMPKI